MQDGNLIRVQCRKNGYKVYGLFVEDDTTVQRRISKVGEADVSNGKTRL